MYERIRAAVDAAKKQGLKIGAMSFGLRVEDGKWTPIGDCLCPAACLIVGKPSTRGEVPLDDTLFASIRDVAATLGVLPSWVYSFYSGFDAHENGHIAFPDAYELGKRFRREERPDLP